MVIQAPREAVVFPHEGFTSSQNVFAGELEFCRNNALKSQCEDIACASRLAVVEFVSHAEKKFDCFFDLFVGDFGEVAFFDES